jgi:hypothetical protein
VNRNGQYYTRGTLWKNMKFIKKTKNWQSQNCNNLDGLSRNKLVQIDVTVPLYLSDLGLLVRFLHKNLLQKPDAEFILRRDGAVLKRTGDSGSSHNYKTVAQGSIPAPPQPM